MIPLKLQLKNFISYGESQIIDFEPYPLICLSGKNGHGKSALLDALTWVIWGQARKVGGTAKADEGLLHLGQTHMMVSLDFSCNSTLYRVRREFALAAGKSHATLEFGIIDPSGSLRALTDKTIRATQAKIETTIGLDYDTFINSAFLRQGQSHEFSKKTPKERKDILATILGLDHYEKLRRLALDKAKEALTQKELGKVSLERIKTELEEKPRITEQLNLIGTTLVEHQKKEEEIHATLAQLKIKAAALANQKAHYEKIEFQKSHLENMLKDLVCRITDDVGTYRRILHKTFTQNHTTYEHERLLLQEELQKMQFLAAQKIELTQIYTAKQEALNGFVQTLQDQYRKSREKLQLAEHSVDVTLASATQKARELEKKKALNEQHLRSLTNEILLLSKEAGLTPDAAQHTTIEKRFERRKAFYHTFISKAQTLNSQLTALEHKKKLTHDSNEAQCPLCEQEVRDKDRLIKKFETQESLLKHQLTRLTALIVELKKALIEDHAALEEAKKRAEHQKMVQVKIAELEKNKERYLIEIGSLIGEEQVHSSLLLQLKGKKEEVIGESKALNESFQAASNDKQYLSLKHEVAHLASSLEKIPFNPTREKQIHERLAYLSTIAAQQATILAEKAQQEERKKTIYSGCEQARYLQHQIRDLSKMLPEHALFAAQEKEQEILENQQRQTLQTLLQEKEALIGQKGALESKKAMLKEREDAYKKEEHTLAAHTSTADEYTTLASALSKDGIQALLIEDALPEIEHEANTLLAKLTDNQAHLSIESLRDLKSGKAKETLDIKISDAVGIRPYELFSGGEAFRIDFALRIALSKLLARRAGTALQTLIIDEGFGSQDEDGLHQMVEALIRIQEDFAKIIVVSHLPSLKEQFPIHFHVLKTAQGSAVTVIEHC